MRTRFAAALGFTALLASISSCGSSGGTSPSARFEPSSPEIAGLFAFDVAETTFEGEPYGTFAATVRIPVSSFRGPHPMMVISTGIGSVGEDASWWAEHLASHGYLSITFTPPNPSEWDLNQWVVGYRAAITAVEQARNRREGPLAKGDPTRAGLLGTSFGGTAVIEVTGTDERVRAAIALAPGINQLVTSFFSGALNAAPRIQVPIQLHMGSNDCILNPREDTVLGFTGTTGRAVLTYYDLIPGPKQYLEIEGGNHTGYRNLLPPGGTDFYSDANLDCPRDITEEEQHRLAAKYVTMWLDRALYGTDTWDAGLFGEGVEGDLEGGFLSTHLEANLDAWILP